LPILMSGHKCTSRGLLYVSVPFLSLKDSTATKVNLCTYLALLYSLFDLVNFVFTKAFNGLKSASRSLEHSLGSDSQ
jgi:hypothetical protein